MVANPVEKTAGVPDVSSNISKQAYDDCKSIRLTLEWHSLLSALTEYQFKLLARQRQRNGLFDVPADIQMLCILVQCGQNIAQAKDNLAVDALLQCKSCHLDAALALAQIPVGDHYLWCLANDLIHRLCDG